MSLDVSGTNTGVCPLESSNERWATMGPCERGWIPVRPTTRRTSPARPGYSAPLPRPPPTMAMSWSSTTPNGTDHHQPVRTYNHGHFNQS